MNRRIITLTNRAPVSILEDDWPCIAYSEYRTPRRDASRKASAGITVRQYADGRTLVYGHETMTTQWQGEVGHKIRVGFLLTRSETAQMAGPPSSAEIVDAIHRVGSALSLSGASPDIAEDLVRECIADLPAEEI